MFPDRTTAGERLAEEIASRGLGADVVLAVPRGGLPLGCAVADRLDAPLDIVAAKKLGAPGNPELAIGAATSDGTLYLNDDVVARLGVTDDCVEAERVSAAETVREKEATYRSGDPLDLEGRRVVVVDDGLATGATAMACIGRVREAGAARIVLAVPVGARDSLEEARTAADEVVVLETPARFGAVGRHYDDFSQVTDEEAMAYLER